MRQLGILLLVIGGFTLSFDIPALRLGDGETWSVIAVRTTLTAIVGLIGWTVARRMGRTGPLIGDRASAFVIALYGTNALTFLLAIQHTTVANVVFILALNPMLTALLSWLAMGERPRTETAAAIIATTVGTAIIVGDAVSAGNLFGDAMALATTILLALALTLTRKHDLDVAWQSLVATAAPALVGWAIVAWKGLSITRPEWIVLDGLVIMPVAFFCLALAPRFVSAPMVAMAFLIETALAPVWVWLIFAERPNDTALLGGTIIVLAVLLHSFVQLRRGRTARTAAV